MTIRWDRELFVTIKSEKERESINLKSKPNYSKSKNRVKLTKKIKNKNSKNMSEKRVKTNSKIKMKNLTSL